MKNLAASVHDRLLNIAKQKDIQFQRILTLYKQEGLLHRIVSTEYEDSIVLKGGLRFYQYQGTAARPTKDIDLLGSDVDETEATLQTILTTASRVQIDDGLDFDENSVTVGHITGQTEHGGIRGYIVGCLGPARTRLQVDMGFGDVITGGPLRRPYRTMLNDRAFSIQTYSDETVAAEKIEAFISLGIGNSRYKDIYDLFELLVVAKVSEAKVVDAAVNTFGRRQTDLPEKPENLADHHWTSGLLATEWSRFLKRIGATSPELNEIQTELLPRLRHIYDLVRARIVDLL